MAHGSASFQLLDRLELDADTRRQPIVMAIPTLSENSGLYPTYYKLNGGIVDPEEEPLASGYLADVY
ncbi:hypothetical protein DXG01_003226 [Tephrocybe rancida]|nr:hypothetical protein DXG01_003226 [Tephrocybe rancida]